jgi:hypothetical protein
MMAVVIGVTCICFAAWRLHQFIHPQFIAAVTEYEKILQSKRGKQVDELEKAE